MKYKYCNFSIGLMMLLLLAGAMPAMAASTEITLYNDYAPISDASKTSSGLSYYADALSLVTAATGFQGIPISVGTTWISDIVADSGNLYILYPDTSPDYGLWIIKSTDGGVHWSDPIKVNDDGSFVSMSSDSHGIYVVHGGSKISFQKSTDGGNSFTPKKQISDMLDVIQVLPFIKVDSNNIYVYHQYDQYNGNTVLLKSADHGESWTNTIVNYHSWSMSIYNDIIYAVFEDSGNLFLAKSANDGISWSEPSLIDSGSTYGFLADSTGLNLLYTKNGELFYRKSLDYGDSWLTPVSIDTDLSGYNNIRSIKTLSNNVYVIYNKNNGIEHSWDLWFRGSNDNGATWSSPIKIARNVSASRIEADTKGVYVICLDQAELSPIWNRLWFYRLAIDNKPDLKVTNIEFSNNHPREGEPVTMYSTIKNNGVGTAYDVNVTFFQRSEFSSDFGNGIGSNCSLYVIDPLPPDGVVTAHISELEPGDSCTIVEPWDAVPIYDTSYFGNIAVCAIEENSFGANFTDISVTHRSNFWPEIDGYHFENWNLTEEERSLENIKALLKVLDLDPKIEQIVFKTTTPDLLGAGGHCYGMSTASILYYIDPNSKPVDKRTFQMLENNPEVKEDIVDYQNCQLLHALTGAILDIKGIDLAAEYQKINKHVKGDTYEPMLLSIWNFSENGGHAVVAINTFDISETIKNVVVYDNNFPGMATVVQFNLASNTIHYGGYNRAYASLADPDIEKGLREAIYKYLRALFGQMITNNLNLLIVDCPVNVTITDQYGRVINDDGINEIPNAEVVTGGDVKLFYLPADLTYTVNIDAYDSGNFTLTQLVPLTNKSASITSFTDIPVNYNTKASVIIDPTEVHGLKIDNNGDGTTDEVKEPDVDEKIGTYSIQLHTGWNLISLPLMSGNTNTASLLSPISGNYSIVWEYNASDTTDNWKKYDPSAPFGNDLTNMEPGKGYWILITSDSTLPITGTVLESTDIDLKTGWNLIGYNSLDSQPITDALSSISGNYDIVWEYDASDTSDHWKKYDPSAPFGNDLTDMEPGKGYWILMNSDDTLEI